MPKPSLKNPSGSSPMKIATHSPMKISGLSPMKFPGHSRSTNSSFQLEHCVIEDKTVLEHRPSNESYLSVPSREPSLIEELRSATEKNELAKLFSRPSNSNDSISNSIGTLEMLDRGLFRRKNAGSKKPILANFSLSDTPTTKNNCTSIDCSITNPLIRKTLKSRKISVEVWNDESRSSQDGTFDGDSGKMPSSQKDEEELTGAMTGVDVLRKNVRPTNNIQVDFTFSDSIDRSNNSTFDISEIPTSGRPMNPLMKKTSEMRKISLEWPSIDELDSTESELPESRAKELEVEMRANEQGPPIVLSPKKMTGEFSQGFVDTGEAAEEVLQKENSICGEDGVFKIPETSTRNSVGGPPRLSALRKTTEPRKSSARNSIVRQHTTIFEDSSCDEIVCDGQEISVPVQQESEISALSRSPEHTRQTNPAPDATQVDDEEPNEFDTCNEKIRDPVKNSTEEPMADVEQGVVRNLSVNSTKLPTSVAYTCEPSVVPLQFEPSAMEVDSVVEPEVPKPSLPASSETRKSRKSISMARKSVASTSERCTFVEVSKGGDGSNDTTSLPEDEAPQNAKSGGFLRNIERRNKVDVNFTLSDTGNDSMYASSHEFDGINPFARKAIGSRKISVAIPLESESNNGILVTRSSELKQPTNDVPDAARVDVQEPNEFDTCNMIFSIPIKISTEEEPMADTEQEVVRNLSVNCMERPMNATYTCEPSVVSLQFEPSAMEVDTVVEPEVPEPSIPVNSEEPLADSVQEVVCELSVSSMERPMNATYTCEPSVVSLPFEPSATKLDTVVEPEVSKLSLPVNNEPRKSRKTTSMSRNSVVSASVLRSIVEVSKGEGSNDTTSPTEDGAPQNAKSGGFLRNRERRKVDVNFTLSDTQSVSTSNASVYASSHALESINSFAGKTIASRKMSAAVSLEGESKSGIPLTDTCNVKFSDPIRTSTEEPMDNAEREVVPKVSVSNSFVDSTERPMIATDICEPSELSLRFDLSAMDVPAVVEPELLEPSSLPESETTELRKSTSTSRKTVVGSSKRRSIGVASHLETINYSNGLTEDGTPHNTKNTKGFLRKIEKRNKVNVDFTLSDTLSVDTSDDSVDASSHALGGINPFARKTIGSRKISVAVQLEGDLEKDSSLPNYSECTRQANPSPETAHVDNKEPNEVDPCNREFSDPIRCSTKELIDDAEPEVVRKLSVSNSFVVPIRQRTYDPSEVSFNHVSMEEVTFVESEASAEEPRYSFDSKELTLQLSRDTADTTANESALSNQKSNRRVDGGYTSDSSQSSDGHNVDHESLEMSLDYGEPLEMLGTINKPSCTEEPASRDLEQPALTSPYSSHSSSKPESQTQVDISEPGNASLSAREDTLIDLYNSDSKGLTLQIEEDDLAPPETTLNSFVRTTSDRTMSRSLKAQNSPPKTPVDQQDPESSVLALYLSTTVSSPNGKSTDADMNTQFQSRTEITQPEVPNRKRTAIDAHAHSKTSPKKLIRSSEIVGSPELTPPMDAPRQKVATVETAPRNPVAKLPPDPSVDISAEEREEPRGIVNSEFPPVVFHIETTPTTTRPKNKRVSFQPSTQYLYYSPPEAHENKQAKRLSSSMVEDGERCHEFSRIQMTTDISAIQMTTVARSGNHCSSTPLPETKKRRIDPNEKCQLQGKISPENEMIEPFVFARPDPPMLAMLTVPGHEGERRSISLQSNLILSPPKAFASQNSQDDGDSEKTTIDLSQGSSLNISVIPNDPTDKKRANVFHSTPMERLRTKVIRRTKKLDVLKEKSIESAKLVNQSVQTSRASSSKSTASELREVTGNGSGNAESAAIIMEGDSEKDDESRFSNQSSICKEENSRQLELTLRRSTRLQNRSGNDKTSAETPSDDAKALPNESNVASRSRRVDNSKTELSQNRFDSRLRLSGQRIDNVEEADEENNFPQSSAADLVNGEDGEDVGSIASPTRRSNHSQSMELTGGASVPIVSFASEADTSRQLSRYISSGNVLSEISVSTSQVARLPRSKYNRPKKPPSELSLIFPKQPKSTKPAQVPNADSDWARKPRKLHKPGKWASERLYRWLEDRLNPKHGIQSTILAEDLVILLAQAIVLITNGRPEGALDSFKLRVKELGLFSTQLEFWCFINKFMAYEIKAAVIPMLGCFGSKVKDNTHVLDPL